jgi:general stress protein YciG
MPDQVGKARRGFAAMDPAKQRLIASKGGQASGGNFRNDPARASEAGRKGGERSQGGGSRLRTASRAS